MDERVQFGLWLKQRRKALHLTQEDLAERISCSGAMVRKIEAGERVASQQLADLLAESFGVVASERPAFVQFAQGRLSLGEIERALWQTLHTVKAHPTNLAAPLTGLIGREHELEKLHKLLLSESGRLFTLTGPPGIGKTRLSLEVGAALLDHFEDGVFFVGLASIVDPDLVLTAIALSLGIPVKDSDSLLDHLQQSLYNKQMLLLLDNFEQILDAAPLVLGLLGSCPNLKALVTSREALHVYGEQLFPVPPLATADSENLPSIQTMRSIPAVALFLERAQAVKPNFVLTEENAGAVAAICTQLDGLPLAIELAAARIRLFSAQEMQARLDSKLPLLTGGPRNLPPRQRTLRAAIDWSYQLLNDGEQTLFARLVVFVGGFTLAAAEAVCNTANDSAFDVQERIESLLDKNLLKRVEGVDGESRFTMLELIHEYSSERLRASGEEEDIRGLHTQYYLALAEVGEQEIYSAKQEVWLRKLEQDHDNIRSTLRWLLDTGQATLALRLSGAMRGFWNVRGHQREGRRWLMEALAGGGNAPAPIRAKSLWALGQLADLQDEPRQVSEWLEESLALYREIGDVIGIAGVLRTLAFTLLHRGEMERAIALCEEGLALDMDPTFQSENAKLFYVIGAAAFMQGDFAQAKEAITKGIAVNQEQGNKDYLAASLNLRGLIAHYQGDYSSAEALYNECMAVSRQVGGEQHLLHANINLAAVILLQGDPLRAVPLLSQGLRSSIELNDKQGIAEALEGVAWLASLVGQPDRCAHLFAAAEALREAASFPLPNFVHRVYEPIQIAARSQMDEAAFTRAWAEGRELTMDQAIEYALGDLYMRADV